MFNRELSVAEIRIFCGGKNQLETNVIVAVIVTSIEEIPINVLNKTNKYKTWKKTYPKTHCFCRFSLRLTTISVPKLIACMYAPLKEPMQYNPKDKKIFASKLIAKIDVFSS